MELYTTTEIPKNLPGIDYESVVMSIGSCFSEHIGKRMSDLRLNCCVNPSGILFNPESVAALLERMMTGKPYEASELFFSGGLYHSPYHHGSFSGETIEKVLVACNGSFQRGCESLSHADVLLITFGTSWVYERRSDGLVVANCHKMPSESFLRRMLSVEDITRRYEELFSRLFAIRPDLKIVLQVSPVRHLADGLHANQISKSVLLLSVEALQRRFPHQVLYFPSYEMMLDEFRDYRFYDRDMAHPSPLAVQLIWERFSMAVFSPQTREIMREVESLNQLMEHRLLHPSLASVEDLMGQIRRKAEYLKEKCPYFDFEKQIELCHTRLIASLKS